MTAKQLQKILQVWFWAEFNKEVELFRLIVRSEIKPWFRDRTPKKIVSLTIKPLELEIEGLQAKAVAGETQQLRMRNWMKL